MYYLLFTLLKTCNKITLKEKLLLLLL